MKKLIEVFNWEHEGDFSQHFFVVDCEGNFIKETMDYLNYAIIHKEFPWSDPLCHYKEEQQVEPYFLIGDTPHLKETYYIDFNYDKGFSLSKRSLDYKMEEIK